MVGYAMVGYENFHDLFKLKTYNKNILLSCLPILTFCFNEFEFDADKILTHIILIKQVK